MTRKERKRERKKHGTKQILFPPLPFSFVMICILAGESTKRGEKKKEEKASLGRDRSTFFNDILLGSLVRENIKEVEKEKKAWRIAS